MTKAKKAVKCEGRFSELRGYLYDQVLPTVLEDRTVITRQDLENMWLLLESDIFAFDLKDRYFRSGVDVLRAWPDEKPLSLVPLIAYSENLVLEENILREVAINAGNSSGLADRLAKMGSQPRKLLAQFGRKEESNIHVPLKEGGDAALTGYVISGNIGIGTITHGGIKGGGIRSDSPYLIEVYQSVPGEGQNLVAVIGYWAQKDAMVVSQMQSCKNAKFPERMKFGMGCLRVAEVVAEAMGFNKVQTYSARTHPIFRAHPEDWKQMGEDFVCVYDCSAKRLGYDGSRNEHHEKVINK